MTPTQIARRSDALYADGTCGMTRRVLCDMVAQRESDLEDARAENAKLREEIEAAKHDLSLFSGELVASKLENSKLRELVRLLLWGVDNDMPRYEELAWTQKVNALVRELGVEVE